ncbi:type III secretion system translocon subunit SctE [Enterobacteriaceae bacterium H20N1]|uniref:Type III secretion system translocon subunit SctE n=1 Tax=Dryocola boscaweniae TaxID=2925397 RepID=A0A9X2W5E6_9ENTR|nr:type III secretion system translocon subunit SctE [Dryocola boscaweniae]MCT4700512.1 type III secretion system translocon subunit SctE [Dryocola boscaweniae]MCT4717668.1 type III secretion system translocon subunit SctE [Dryocola boscaweniae]
MSYNTLKQTSGSRMAGSSGAQTMVTSAQVMQFLEDVGPQGGRCGLMAQNVLQLMQQTPALHGDLTRQLTPLVQMNAPGESQIARTLDDISVRYQPQIAALPARAGGERQQAGQRLAETLTNLSAARTPQGIQLLSRLRQGDISSGLLKQLEGLLYHAATAGHSLSQPALKEALSRLQRAVPESKAELSKLSKQLDNPNEAKMGEMHSREKTAVQKSVDTSEQWFVDTGEQKAPLGERHQRGREEESGAGGQAWNDDEESETLCIGSFSPVPGVINEAMRPYSDVTAREAKSQPVINSTPTALHAEDVSARTLSMVLPPAAATVSPQQAQYSVQHILKDNHITLSSLVSGSLDNMLLQAATLGLKTFSNSAEALSKSIKINGDAQEALMDRKIADYREQLAKAQEQAEKAKKGGILGKIFNPIMTVISAIIKPVMNLLEKIPGVKSAMDFITKNLSEIAFPLAVVTAIFCPMSLPMTLGLLAVTATTAGFSIAEKVMGDKAPSWLKITDRVGDMVSGAAMAVCTGVMAGGLLRVSGIAGRVSGWLSDSALKALEKADFMTRMLTAITDTGNGVAQAVLGVQQANLQGEIGVIDARLGWNDAQARWLISAQEYTVDRVQREISRSATVVESASKMLSETATLRARIAGSLI